jgi:prepilin-type processing-associated H-X9-DG protein
MRRGEETANLVQSNNFMKQIGLACQLYANDHGGQYPDTLGRLLLTEDIPADVFVSPQSDDTPARGPTTQAVVDELNKGGHSSYHYVGCGLTTAADPVTVVAYEDPAIFKRGGNVLYADGHVEFDDAATLMRIASGDYPASRPVTESSTSRP